jgi:hypothetical protein
MNDAISTTTGTRVVAAVLDPTGPLRDCTPGRAS